MPVQDLGLGFSGSEATQVALGVGVMTLAFAVAYIGGAQYIDVYFRLGGAPLLLLIFTGSFVAVVTGFFAHELAHKAIAQRYGRIAEYRYSAVGLFNGLVTASIGWMLAMPGAVVVSGRVSPREHVRISVAGPAINLSFAGVFIGLSVLLGTAPARLREPIPIFIGAIAFVNVLLAGFNVIPVPPIELRLKVARRIPLNFIIPANDGLMILKSSKAVWAASVVALVLLGVGGHLLEVF